MGSFRNTLSWSRSRKSTFDGCKREYWFQYYGSWGGWEWGSEARTRRIYALKHLRTRWMWAGTVVHEAVQRALERQRDGHPVDPAQIEEASIEAMREQFRASRGRLYLQRPKVGGLVEHHHRHLAIEDAAWAEVAEHVRHCIRGYFASPWPAELDRVAREDWLAIEDLRSQDMDGTPIWIVPDLAFRRHDDFTCLVDWKTSRGASGPDPIQLRIYALYALERWGAEPDKIEAVEVHLATGEQYDLHVDAGALDETRAAIHESLDAMRGMLLDVDDNVAREEDFPRTDDEGRCGRCRFLEVCRPELLAQLVA